LSERAVSSVDRASAF